MWKRVGEGMARAGNQRADELMAMPTTPPKMPGRRRAPSKRGQVDSYNWYRRLQPLAWNVTLLRIYRPIFHLGPVLPRWRKTMSQFWMTMDEENDDVFIPWIIYLDEDSFFLFFKNVN